MGNIVRKNCRNEMLEEPIDFYERYNTLYNNIKGVLNADKNVTEVLLSYFPDEPVDYLFRFWLDMENAIINDYEIYCERL